MTKTWIKEFPTEEGLYWFYGYRYGKISCGFECKPELLLVRANKTGCRGSLMYVSEGTFMFESEVEEPHFIKASLPVIPIIEE